MCYDKYHYLKVICCRLGRKIHAVARARLYTCVDLFRCATKVLYRESYITLSALIASVTFSWKCQGIWFLFAILQKTENLKLDSWKPKHLSFKRISVANSIFRKTIFFRYLSCYSLLVDYSWLHATTHVIARGKPRWGRRWPHMKQFAYDQTCVDKMCTAFPYFLTYYYLPIDLKKHQYSQNFF